MSWKSGSSSTVRSYQFLYDNQNFLTWATYLENNTANSRYTTRYVYDSMGNITTLWRYGLRDNNTYGLIDNLSYTYNGNQLVTVTDGSSGPNYSGAFHFSDGADEDVEYEYDQNGNLTKDLNKKITQIKYNLLNLPSNIAFMINYANYYISHTYSADGRLLHTGYLIGKDMGSVPATSYPVFPHGGDELQAHIIDVPITPPIEPSLIDNSYSYCDNIIYHQGTVSQILFDGGYVTLSGSTPTYHYYLQDHLGNNRVVVKQDGTIEQVNHYYPFGGLFGESTDGDVQRFKYNGKELERMHGLDWYDYGARWHDAALGRWATVDPMAEKYYHLSPYNYCGNNPIKFVDPDGRDPGDYFKTKDDAAMDFGMLFNANSIRENREYGSIIYQVSVNEKEIYYSYIVPVIGQQDRTMVGQEPIGTTPVATIHTHGAYSHGKYYDNQFSGIRKNGTKFLSIEERAHERGANDIGNANKRKMDSYIVTPNGTLQKYSPADNTISILSYDMPSDPNDSSRLNSNGAFINRDLFTNNKLLKMLRNVHYCKTSSQEE